MVNRFVGGYFLLSFFELGITLFMFSISMLFPSYMMHNVYLYFIFIVILFLLKKIRDVTFFSPEFSFLISYFLFFVMPFYLYQNGFLLENAACRLVMLESFRLFLILEFISLLFFVKARRKKIVSALRRVKLELDYKRLVTFNWFLIVVRVIFLIMGYKTNAISSLNSFSYLDIIYVPVFQLSLFSLFLSLWILYIGKINNSVLRYQSILFLLLDVL